MSMSKIIKIVFFAVVLALAIPISRGAERSFSLVINELMASNSDIKADPQGRYDDWIELYNYGTDDIDIGGMYLTDDLTVPTKWQIPAMTNIPSGGFLLIWADDDTNDAGLHANFKLDAAGEEIGLFDTDGNTLIDSIIFGEQINNISFGRYPDASDNWRFFDESSPASENTIAYEGFVSDVQFSIGHGFCDAPFSLTLATETEGAEIYYTTDSSEPYDIVGRNLMGILYTSPILISRTTCLRAIAIRPDWKPSNITTNTYIFPDDVIRQPANPEGFPGSWGSRTADYAMDQRVVDDPAYRDEIKDDLKSTPSVCIVINNEDFFGSRGIYANATATGDQWERAASIEWIDPNTGDSFAVNAGLRIHGGPYSRSGSSKNALRIIFRSEYGLSKLQYSLFPDAEVETFNTLTLRAIWNYSWTGHSGMSGSQNADYLRDAFARDTVRDMGNITPYGRAVQVYINGLYWGMYIMTERPDEHFVAEHLGGNREDYDVLEAPSGMGASTTMEIISGGEPARQAWDILFELANGDLTSSEAYQEIQRHIDLANMVDYMLMIYYTGSRDAPVFLGDSYTPRNFYVTRKREPASPFIIVPWDTEWALEQPQVNRVNVVGVYNPHYLIDRLLENSDFRVLMADRIHRHFYNGGALTVEQATQRYMARANEINGAIVGESARWGDSKRPSQPYTRDVDWAGEVNRLVNEYFSVRTDIVMNQIRQAGLYPSVSAPEFYVNGQSHHGGHITPGDTITMTGDGGNIWYTTNGTDPRREGVITRPAGELTLVPENASKRAYVPTSDISDSWKDGQLFDDSSWLASTGGPGGVGYERSTGFEDFISIDLRDRMYGRNSSCYIRIPFTIGTNVEEIRSLILKVRYDDGFIAYLNGREVARRNFSGVPSWDSYALAQNSDSAAVNFENINISDFLNDLQQGNNLLAIQGLNVSTTSSDFLICVELVADFNSWTDVDDGIISTGALEYTGPISLPYSAHIKARVLQGSTWSALNEATFSVGPVMENLRITEIMYNPGDPNTEYIELKNVGTEIINLNLV
ncbi:MAG: CotH kinase family protein, partial [Sedimentisphaerales bacterium]|nr:CotH kinase family protein [Sedimentisphaerales bacterium]